MGAVESAVRCMAVPTPVEKEKGHGHGAGRGNYFCEETLACSFFQMPLHYPRYRREDYDSMPEWRLDCLLREYGLPVSGDVAGKRELAKGAFLWSS